jgi:hypothetical protein
MATSARVGRRVPPQAQAEHFAKQAHLSRICDIARRFPAVPVKAGSRQRMFQLSQTRDIAYVRRREVKGHLEKLKQPAIAGIFGVNSTESNREQNGIIGGQIWGA